MSATPGRVILGIDLGTTYSAVAVWREDTGEVQVIRGPDNDPLVPSVVAWDADRERWAVGRAADDIRRTHPERTAYSVKRFIGRPFDPAMSYGRQPFPFRLVESGDPDPLRAVAVEFAPDRRLTVPAVSALVLGELRRMAAAALGRPLADVQDAVITVPAYFNDRQRRATLKAGELAGLNVLDLLHEPTAAALAYADPEVNFGPGERWVLVVDLGGGTFDVSLLRAGRTRSGYVFATRVVDGDTALGGDDIDTAVVSRLTELAEGQVGRLDRDHPATRDALRRAAERAKVELSAADETAVPLAGLVTADGRRADAHTALTRRAVEAAAEPVRKRVREIARRAVVEAAGMGWEEVAAVVLVGGQTRMPAVRGDVAALTGRDPRADRPPELAVALGAGEYARILGRGEAVAHQNALIDVLALPYGIRLNRNEFAPLVDANATLPVDSEPFPVTTTQDDQTEVVVDVYQGARGVTSTDECVHLGKLVLPELEPAKAGVPVFDVTFEVQRNGTLRVAVADRRTGRREVLDIVGKTAVVLRDPTPAAAGG